MRYLLPYAFARSAGLLLGENAGRLTRWVSGGSQRQALAEVMRCHGAGPMPLDLQRLPADELVQRISSAYAQGESSAAAVVAWSHSLETAVPRS